MTIIYSTARITGPGLGLLPPPHGFPVDPIHWWVPLTLPADDGDPIGMISDLTGTENLAQFGAGGKTLSDNGVARVAVLNNVPTNRLQTATTLTTIPATVVALTRVAAPVNANIIGIGPYVIQRAISDTRLTLMDIGKTSTNWIRIPDAGVGWILWAAVLNGPSSSLRIHGGATAGPGTVDGTGTPGVTILASNTTAAPIEVAEIAVLPGALSVGSITTAFAAVQDRWPTLVT